jgi:hypothetical protein
LAGLPPVLLLLAPWLPLAPVAGNDGVLVPAVSE